MAEFVWGMAVGGWLTVLTGLLVARWQDHRNKTIRPPEWNPWKNGEREDAEPLHLEE